ncbi:MAG: AMP-binding protein, partial [Hyphomicrobium denitrificans]|nr:AMP-binding protein [Hyphomicrobium denitrificans]
MSVSIAIAAEPEASAQVSPEATLPGLLRLHATRHPNAAAIVASTNAGAVRLGFAALDRLVDTVAENLSALRLPAASGIAIPAHNRIETVVSMLAAMRADHTAVLLPPLWRE